MKKFLPILTILTILGGLLPISAKNVNASSKPIQYPTLWEKLVVGPYRPFTIAGLLILLVGLVALLLFIIWKREKKDKEKKMKKAMGKREQGPPKIN